MAESTALAERLTKEELDQAIDRTTAKQSDDLTEKAIEYSELTKVQAQILRAEIQEFTSESSRTVAERAEYLGISPCTIYRAHNNQHYRETFDRLTDQLFQYMGHIGYESIVKSARDGKVSAAKLILEITGKHVDKIETANVNVNVDIASDTPTSPRLVLENMLTMLGTRGWTIEEITEIWYSLKESQAF